MHSRSEHDQQQLAEARRIYREILARTPEHDFDPTLDRVRRTVDLLGSPQHAYRVIHVTGTNGKTSTARMAERLVREHGLRTGLFTSPHLADVRERIAIDGEPISPEAFVEVWGIVSPVVDLVDAELGAAGQSRLSFFEVLTVMALVAFAEAPVDVAVLEVGMGGSWDSTNVADGEVAVLTSVALDHERYLGDTVEQIAEVKSGIIKPGATVVVGDLREEAMTIVQDVAAQHGARLVRDGLEIAVLERQLAVGGQVMALRGLGGVYADVFVPLHGEHQGHNALLALVAAEALLSDGSPLGAEAVGQAFANVKSPGRIELARVSPAVLVDAAHNPAGALALAATIEEAFDFRTLVGVVGVLDDKDPEGILSVLEPVLSEIVVTRSSSARALDPDELGEIARDVFGEDRVHVVDRLDAAIDVAVQLSEREDSLGAGVLVTGSVTMVADARHLLGKA